MKGMVTWTNLKYMKKFFLFIVIVLVNVIVVQAQPQKSRVQNNKNATARKGTTVNTSRADLMFPTAVDVPEDPIWRRDIYRQLDLTLDENAALYYPIQPQDNEMNLFTLLFKLLSQGKIPAYKIDLNSGREDFRQSNRLHFKEMLENYSIYYEVEGNSIKVEDSDIPSADVKTFYVKESSYYDQNTATYHSRITALCPLIEMNNDFSFSASKSPMFWVKYDDIKTYLSNHQIMTSNVNNAARMSMDDFFSTNHYKGDIYMTTNMQGKSLAQMLADSVKTTQPVDSATLKVQKRIEKEMVDFEEHIWNEPVDSVAQAKKDSIAAASKSKKSKAKDTEKLSSTRNSRAERASKPKKEKSGSNSSSSSGGGAARVSVRRQRH